MKDTIIKKLTIIIEATNGISDDVMKTISNLEKSIAPNPKLKLSLVPVNDPLNKNPDYVSPENWDYWEV